MNTPRVTAEEYIQLLLGTPSAVSATETARVQPVRSNAPAHDAFTRLLHRLEPDPSAAVTGREVARCRGGPNLSVMKLTDRSEWRITGLKAGTAAMGRTGGRPRNKRATPQPPRGSLLQPCPRRGK